jgi:hypothetical protein
MNRPIWRKGWPKKSGWYWRKCSEARISERIEFVSPAMAKTSKSNAVCLSCRWAGPMPRPVNRRTNRD